MLHRNDQRPSRRHWDPRSPLEWPYPDKRPALWLRMLFTFLWLPTLLGFVAAFLLGFISPIRLI